MGGQVIAVCISERKGTPKRNIERSFLIENRGLEGDAHAGDWHRQVSLLAEESIEKMRMKGFDVKSGGFAENIATRDIDLASLPAGTRLQVGKDVILEVTQIGKPYHDRRVIGHQADNCVISRESVFAREGIFANVIKGGEVKVGDAICAEGQSL
ncbi:MAG: MOSC domain-containing protein [Firmicutes bacterium]|nr:MOSC domain-containing protein [Bacillota bacterium]